MTMAYSTDNKNYTYVLRCADGSLYTGWTNNLENRVATHNAGQGAKYTRAHRPVELVYYEVFDTKEEAMKREYAIKHISTEEKRLMVMYQCPVVFNKKKIKNMYIRVREGASRIDVSAPCSVSAKRIEEFVLKNDNWIRGQLEAMRMRPSDAVCRYEEGDKVRVFGETYSVRVVSCTGRDKAVLDDSLRALVIHIKNPDDYATRVAAVDRMFRKLLERELTYLFPICERQVGKKCAEWHIRDMKTKWGTCNIAKKRIWINLRLIHKPKICLTYVVIHELTHLYVPNHGPEFKTYMDRFCENWRDIKKMMD